MEYSSTQTQVARNFAQLVANRFWKQEVYLCDEKYTSIVANERLAQRGVNLLSAKELVDSEAAVVLLERFFGGWSNDKSGVYLKLVTRQQDNTREGVDHVEEQQPDHEEKTTYRPYREWRRKLLRQQN